MDQDREEADKVPPVVVVLPAGGVAGAAVIPVDPDDPVVAVEDRPTEEDAEG